MFPVPYNWIFITILAQNKCRGADVYLLNAGLGSEEQHKIEELLHVETPAAPAPDDSSLFKFDTPFWLYVLCAVTDVW